MRSRRLNRLSQHGFTLIELVIAISILMFVMTFAYSALSSIVQSKTALDDGRDADMVANAVLTRLTRELSLAALGTSGETLFPPCDPGNSSPTFPNVRLLGEKQTLRSGERGDSISFIAADAGQYLPDGGTHTGLVQISYRVLENEERDDQGNRGLATLIREEIPFIIGSTAGNVNRWKQACKKSMTFPITDHLTNLAFQYFEKDTGKWVDAWNGLSVASRPSLIRFSITLRSPRGVTRTYATSVPVR